MLLEILRKLRRFVRFWLVMLFVLTTLAVIVHWPEISSLITGQVDTMFRILLDAVVFFVILFGVLYMLIRPLCRC